MRILKPNGLFYLNVPSNGDFHQFPVDCWRFYPDAALALVNWGRRSGYNPMVLESFWGKQGFDAWNDHVSVFLKDKSKKDQHKSRIIDEFIMFTNGIRDDSADVINRDHVPEDRRFSFQSFFRLVMKMTNLSVFFRR